MDQWPNSLRATISTLLECQLPMYLAWGPDLIQFYNDAYKPILGHKDEAALGNSAPVTWCEIWPTIGPMWREVLSGKSIGFDDFKLTIERFGYPEDCYFNFSYSPVRDDDGQAMGVLVTFAETTKRVLAERRFRFLDDLSQAVRAQPDPSEVMRLTATMLGTHLGWCSPLQRRTQRTESADAAQARRGGLRHWHARHGRFRTAATDSAIAAGSRRHDAGHSPDRLRAPGGSPARFAGRLQRPPAQADRTSEHPPSVEAIARTRASQSESNLTPGCDFYIERHSRAYAP